MHLSCVSSLMETDCDKSTSPVVTETGCVNISLFLVCVLFLCLFFLHPQLRKGSRSSSVMYSVQFLGCPELLEDLELNHSSCYFRIFPSKESKQKTCGKVKLFTCLGNTALLFLAVWEARNTIRGKSAAWYTGKTVLMTCRTYTGITVPTFCHPLLWPPSSLTLWVENKCPNVE